MRAHNRVLKSPGSIMITATQPSTRHRGILRSIARISVATICGLTAGFAAEAFCFALLSAQAPGTRDYVVYWATGQQVAHHADPYDGVALLKAERSAGFPASNQTLYMRNPPWTLLLVYPLGSIGARAGWVIWSLLLVGCLVSSVHLLWHMYGRPGNRRVLLGYSFAPALICLIYGQTSLLALLGLVLFLRWHGTRPFLAGISLWLCALKPHLFLPFGVVLLAWIIVSRSYKILAGAATALAASCALAFVIDPMAWSQYAQMVPSGIETDFIPCLSFLLRHWTRPQSMWIQYIPAVVACAWAFLYFWQRRNHWDWTKDGTLVLLVSILAAPYCWLFDQVLAIPALLHGAFRTRSWNVLAALALATAMVEIALFYDVLRSATAHLPAIHHWTYWTAPAWLAWYLVANSSFGATEATRAMPLADATSEWIEAIDNPLACFRGPEVLISEQGLLK